MMNEVSGFCYSENRWTDGELAQEWIEKYFDATTKEKANGQTWVLIMDGHSSHHKLDLLRYAQEHNIIVLGYCTHVLQGLDVVCFAKMKTEF